jgi:hypothetical protein
MAIETQAFLFGWTRVNPGREALAGELFASTLGYWEKLQKAGKIASFEPVFLQAHGGDLNGFFFIKGTHAKLDAVKTDEEFVDLVLRAGHCLDGVGVIPAYTGNVVGEMMTRWTKSAPRGA